MVSRYVIIIACLLASIVCYAMGVHAGILVFVLLGLVFEMVFWMGIAKRSSVDEDTALSKERP